MWGPLQKDPLCCQSAKLQHITSLLLVLSIREAFKALISEQNGLLAYQITVHLNMNTHICQCARDVGLVRVFAPGLTCCISPVYSSRGRLTCFTGPDNYFSSPSSRLFFFFSVSENLTFMSCRTPCLCTRSECSVQLHVD